MPLVLIGGAIVIAAVFASAGLAYQSNALAKALVGFLQGFGPLGNFLAGLVGGPVVALTSWISHELGVAFQKVEQLGVRWLSGLNQYINYMAEHGLGWAAQLLKMSAFLQTWYIPSRIAAAMRAVEKEIVALYKHMPVAGHIVIRLPKISKAQVRAAVAALLPGVLVHELPAFRWLTRHVHALEQAIAHDLPLHLPRTIPNIGARLKRLERITAGGLAIAAIVAALARLGISWVRCGNVKKVGRSTCRMDSGLLDSLLLDTLAIGSIISVITFARELRAIEGEAVTIMGKLVREFPSA